MALDIYVMPLWRFKAGDFTSPVEDTLGIKPEVISLSEPRIRRPPWYLRLLERIGLIEFAGIEAEPSPTEQRETALREVAELKAELSRLAGADVDWPDHGGMHYNKQFHGSGIIRAFAVWSDHRDALPTFDLPEGHDYYKHPAWKLPRPSHSRFPLLVQHSLHVGYFLPVEFEGCHQVEPFKISGRWDSHHSAASTPAVLRELQDLLALAGTLPAPQAPEGSGPVGDVKIYAQELERICALSMEHKLPVIFYG